jgi:GrpB-like predicted nucleotidyltransferase (UPF0157 family)
VTRVTGSSGPPEHRDIVLVAPDPAWPARFAAERDRIRAALGDVRVEHIGSTAGSAWEARHLAFRDRLRADPAARERYAAVKREHARRDWPTMDDYADAKSDVIAEISRPRR